MLKSGGGNSGGGLVMIGASSRPHSGSIILPGTGAPKPVVRAESPKPVDAAASEEKKKQPESVAKSEVSISSAEITPAEQPEKVTTVSSGKEEEAPKKAEEEATDNDVAKEGSNDDSSAAEDSDSDSETEAPAKPVVLRMLKGKRAEDEKMKLSASGSIQLLRGHEAEAAPKILPLQVAVKEQRPFSSENGTLACDLCRLVLALTRKAEARIAEIAELLYRLAKEYKRKLSFALAVRKLFSYDAPLRI